LSEVEPAVDENQHKADRTLIQREWHSRVLDGAKGCCFSEETSEGNAQFNEKALQIEHGGGAKIKTLLSFKDRAVLLRK